MLSRLRPSTLALVYAGFGAAWIVFSGEVLSFATDDTALKDRIELAKGLAFVLATSAMFYLLLRSRLRAAESDLAGRRLIDRRYVTPLLVLSTLTIPAVGLLVYLVQGSEDRKERLESLEAIADLKMRQIQAWVADRRGDGIDLAASTGFIASIRALHAGTEGNAKANILNRLNAVREVRGYDSAILFDAAGKPSLAVGETHEGKLPGMPAAEGAGRDGRPWMVGPFRDAAGRLHLDFVVPLHADDRGNELIGTILLHANPDRDLFPKIWDWPTASASGESNLVRRDGDAVDFINALRFPVGRLPEHELRADSAKLVAAMALRAGKAGAARGTDYRGVPVLGAWRPVPGTDWHVVVKTDLHEAMAETREIALWVTLIAFLATLVVGSALVAYLREGQRVKELALQAESDRLLRHFYQLPFVGMAITSPATRRWMQFNDSLCEILGYPREEVARMSWTEVTHPEDLTKDVAEFERVMRGESEGYAMEKRFVRKNGEVVFAEIDVKCVRLPDGAVDYFVATVRDVTGRTLDQQRIVRQSRFYAGLSACNAAIARCANEDELYGAVCRLAVDSAGMEMAWVGIVDADAMVQVRASYGRGKEYLQDIRVSVRADDPLGRGLTGTAIRDDRPSWCEDFQSDPRTVPWHERAREYRWGSTAALPIRRGGIAIGALNIYSGEVGDFDDDARSLLLDMAANISFALDNFEGEAARQRAEVGLERQLDELRRWNAVTLGREERILELKREVNELLRGAGKPPRYSSTDAPEAQEG